MDKLLDADLNFGTNNGSIKDAKRENRSLNFFSQLDK